MMFAKRMPVLILFASLLALPGCGAPPVAVSECAKVVKHIKGVLKEKAPSTSELTKQCKEATDDQRGCAMAADKPMKLLQCM